MAAPPRPPARGARPPAPPTPTPRAAGRPRDPGATAAILDAALDLLAADGYRAMTTDAVAARARASKATVYRRWPSKPALAADAIRHALGRTHAAPPAATAADARLAVTAVLERIIRALRGSPLGPALRALVSEAAAEPVLGRALAEVDEEARAHGPLRASVLRAQAAGYAPAADPELLIDLLLGPLYFQLLVRQTAPDPALAAAVVAHVLPDAPERP